MPYKVVKIHSLYHGSSHKELDTLDEILSNSLFKRVNFHPFVNEYYESHQFGDSNFFFCYSVSPKTIYRWFWCEYNALYSDWKIVSPEKVLDFVSLELQQWLIFNLNTFLYLDQRKKWWY